MALTQNLAINPFQGQVHVDRKPEFIEDTKIEVSRKVNSVFTEYKEIHSYLQATSISESLIMTEQRFEVLTPGEIDLILQLIINANLEGKKLASIVASQLINDSYNAGNNNFSLTISDKVLKYDLFSKVIGTKIRPVTATVFGNVGSYFGYFSEHCAIDIKGNVGDSFGTCSKHCNYTIHGNAGYHCGAGSNECIYDITGIVGDFMGNDSQKSTYDVNGDVGTLLGSGTASCTFNIRGKTSVGFNGGIHNSSFKVRDQETYNNLYNNLLASNKIQLLDSNEKIIMEKRKNCLP